MKISGTAFNRGEVMGEESDCGSECEELADQSLCWTNMLSQSLFTIFKLFSLCSGYIPKTKL
jgi:hypothetical protein